MERNSFSNNLKEHSLEGTKTMREKESNKNLNRSSKDHPRSSNSSHGHGDQDYLGGFSWPPRSYSCCFCKREFRSAQALGGHMNVHRRDRARLRQSSPSNHGNYPLLNLSLNPNPNPNFSPSSFIPHPFPTTLPSLVSPHASSLSSPSPVASPSKMKSTWALERTLIDPSTHKTSDLTNMKGGKSYSELKDLDAFTEEDDECKLLKKDESIVRLDLEIGLLSDSKEDLDLELRLGYS
ncbi:hypothetical protein SLEP1_g49714 [Rubroshorea leprosula]|uniref:C2H2-type domain-containing protein n=1 Tax=Rubroshorea leprosula TaxID=152421 RepID=A0AAV5LYH8_9ROSI|nr:hypothetical protein SLEP1_g49714 [Rubroshorea leprosula]